MLTSINRRYCFYLENTGTICTDKSLEGAKDIVKSALYRLLASTLRRYDINHSTNLLRICTISKVVDFINFDGLVTVPSQDASHFHKRRFLQKTHQCITHKKVISQFFIKRSRLFSRRSHTACQSPLKDNVVTKSIRRFARCFTAAGFPEINVRSLTTTKKSNKRNRSISTFDVHVNHRSIKKSVRTFESVELQIHC